MQRKPGTKLTTTSIAKLLPTVLGEEVLDEMARGCGFLRRKRDVTPLTLLCACVSTLAVSSARSLADILRTFNEFTGKSVRYKPFHKQLSKASLPELFRRVLERTMQNLTMPVLEQLPSHKLGRFKDILLHDRTSFALKNVLVRVFPGRFTKASPAAVELHVTMSALYDNPHAITLAPDKEAERQFAPIAADVKGCLLLEDRGYEARSQFIELDSAGAFFIVRGNARIKPTVLKAYDDQNRRVRHLEGKRLRFAKLPGQNLDLQIEWGSGAAVCRGRLVVRYRRGTRNRKLLTLLHTNLSRDAFSAHEVGQLYRLRWQIELLFKEWKSYANLHRFDTSKPAIAEAMIWASLIAATLKRFLAHAGERVLQIELSTLRVAASARHFLDRILKALLHSERSLAHALGRAFVYMGKNALRAHPARDRKTGRLSAGLHPISTR